MPRMSLHVENTIKCFLCNKLYNFKGDVTRDNGLEVVPPHERGWAAHNEMVNARLTLIGKTPNEITGMSEYHIEVLTRCPNCDSMNKSQINVKEIDA